MNSERKIKELNKKNIARLVISKSSRNVIKTEIKMRMLLTMLSILGIMKLLMPSNTDFIKLVV